MRTKCCSGDGERRKDKGCGGGPTSKTKLCVTKLYVKDGVWRRKMVCVCDKAVCERWCVWKLCVKESVWQSCVWKMVCDKVGWKRWCETKCCVTKWCVKDGATPATQNAAASPATSGDQNGPKARHLSQPRAISATPATQNEGGCRQVPCLPRETKVDDGVWERWCERWCV